MIVVLDGGVWLWWWWWWLIVVVRGTNNPLSRATPGGLGAPCGGETHSRTTFNPILQDKTRPNKTHPPDPVLPSHIYRRLL